MSNLTLNQYCYRRLRNRSRRWLFSNVFINISETNKYPKLKFYIRGPLPLPPNPSKFRLIMTVGSYRGISYKNIVLYYIIHCISSILYIKHAKCILTLSFFYYFAHYTCVITKWLRVLPFKFIEDKFWKLFCEYVSLKLRPPAKKFKRKCSEWWPWQHLSRSLKSVRM